MATCPVFYLRLLAPMPVRKLFARWIRDAAGKPHINQWGLRSRASRARRVRRSRSGSALERLEPRLLLTSDFGDAPDTSAGSGASDYQTVSANGGPSHLIDTTQTTLFLGNSVDGDSGMLQNARANADDVGGALPDDEDGVLNPLDLQGVIGAAPTITLLVTNTTGTTATLSGWIDYDQNGVFDNATERAQASVATGTTDGRITLTFPAIPSGVTGMTYARFRLSTDAAASSATGAASDGEVEDYLFTITGPGRGTVDSFVNIAGGSSGGPTSPGSGGFGSAVTPLGDLDGDGVTDLAVGAPSDFTTGSYELGAVHVLFLNADGSVKSSTTISDGINGGPTLANGDRFGSSVTAVGDLDGDGIIDLAVGARGDDTGGNARGAVYVLLLNADGSARSTTKIAHQTNGGPTLANFDDFGCAVTSVGDLDGDGITDLAVGARRHDTSGNSRGAVYVLFLNANGSVRNTTRIASGSNGGPTLATADYFGSAVTSLGDLDGDGITDLAVGARGDNTGGTNRGAVYVLLLNANGSARTTTKIASDSNGGPMLANGDWFGSAMSSMGDLDGDGVNDLAVGAYFDNTGGTARGAAYVLLLNADGSAKSTTKIAHQTNGGPTLVDSDFFGSAVASLGDLNRDGITDLAVGARYSDIGGFNLGAVYMLFGGDVLPDFGDAPDTSGGTGAGDFATTLASDGPQHAGVAGFGLRLGTSVDGDSGTLQNVAANADDLDGALPDDEDGVLSPLDLQGTIGTAPTVTLLVTNTTGTAAALSGWIDYNQNGVFDNASERAQASIPTGTIDARVTLTFPPIPSGVDGKTYARFRLSTDSAAANATGAASDGEVEDYVFRITAPASGGVDSFLKIASGTNGGPTLTQSDRFGRAVSSIGDVDGDGIIDLAVGALGDDTGGYARGAVYVLLLNANGSVKTTTKIAHETNGGPTLANSDYFGSAVTSLGDLDGDGIADLAVGAYQDNTGGNDRGAVHVLFLNADGSVKSITRIASGTNGGPTLANDDLFGTAVTSLGDLDGDGITDLAVGAPSEDTGGSKRGALYVLFLNTDGSVKSTTKIAHQTNGGPSLTNGDEFGSGATPVGDLDGDGIIDLAVGARFDDTGGTNRGAVHVMLLNADGSVKSTTKIANGMNGGPTLSNEDQFGRAVTSVGDLDGDGITDLIAGADRDDTGGSARGALYVMLLNADGSAKSTTKIASGTNGGPTSILFGTAASSVGDLDGDGITDLAAGAYADQTGGISTGAVFMLFGAEALADFGDAPDTGAGAGPANYQTTTTNGGPQHLGTAGFGLRLGASVDGDDGTLQNITADADDVDGALPDDEDGVLSPLDLQGTIGAAPGITLLVTNTTGAAATLSGWIDYNQDGVFDNAAERAQASVASGTTDARVTLTFPAIPDDGQGTTYARFRLSTDVAASNPTGVASDGEVEDYLFTITAAGSGVVDSSLIIASGTNGGPPLNDSDFFGSSVTSLGDLDGDGVNDMAVGARADGTGGSGRGAVYVLHLNADGSVKSTTKLAHETNGGPTLADSDIFGSSVTAVGDLDGDGVTELAVGARFDGTGGRSRGAVHVLFLNPDGSAKSSTKIASGTNGGPTLSNFDYFGTSVASLGDLDGDGVNDLAVGSNGNDTGGSFRGAVHILLLNNDGSTKDAIKIANGTNGGPTLVNGDQFGSAVTSLGDLDGDGVADLAVGVRGDDTGGRSRGAVYALLLNSDGSVKSSTKIAHQTNGGPTLSDDDFFGYSTTALGDLNGDGIADLAVGAWGDDTGGTSRGAVHVLLMNADGSAQSSAKIAHQTNGGPTLGNDDRFGSSVTSLGDVDGDDIIELAVGARVDSTGGFGRGAVHVLFLTPQLTVPTISAPGNTTPDQRPVITWEAVEGASEYEVWIGNQSTSTNPIPAGHRRPRHSLTHQLDLGIGKFNLWVRAKNGAERWSVDHAIQLHR
jgi:hypothetical protein